MPALTRSQERLLAAAGWDLTSELLASGDRWQRPRQQCHCGAGLLTEHFAGCFTCTKAGVLFNPWEGDPTLVPYRAVRQHRDCLPATVRARLDHLLAEATRIAVTWAQREADGDDLLR